MEIIIYPNFKEKIEKTKTQNEFVLIGRIFDDFDVIHLTDIYQNDDSNLTQITENDSKVIGYGCLNDEANKTCICSEDKSSYTFSLPFSIDEPHLYANFNRKTMKLIYVGICSNGKLKEKEIENITVVDNNRLFIRIDKEDTPLGILRNKKVAIIGMGSGGSVLAVHLAKSGVKKFIFVDDDRLETHNIVRHICSQKDIGRYKTLAVKDYLIDRIPELMIETLEENFNLDTNDDIMFFEKLFHDTNLIIAASGEHNINYLLNDFVHTTKVKKPIVFAGTFDKIIGGLMFRVDPNKNETCYHCVYLDTTKKTGVDQQKYPLTKGTDLVIEYDRNLDDKLSQPGLGLDIDNLTIFLSKFTLDTLLDNVDHNLYKFGYNFYIWYNRDILSDNPNNSREGLELYYYEKLEKNNECPFHGSK